MALLLASFVVVGALGLPDASDVETLQEFADIESGRVAEHLLYLGSLTLFALHTVVLYRLLTRAHQAAALFGTVIAEFGFVILAASSLLHVSTAPLAELHSAPGTSPQDQAAIEYSWHGAQSVFDTMLATGALLVPIGLALLGLAMWNAPAYGARTAAAAIGLGLVGSVGAVIGVVDAGSAWLAVAVIAIALFHLIAGWRTLALSRRTAEPTDPVAG